MHEGKIETARGLVKRVELAVVFVVAGGTTSARNAAQQKWSSSGRGHVVAVTRLNMIDGYNITVEEGGTGDVIDVEGYN
jgi:hypothetical protein